MSALGLSLSSVHMHAHKQTYTNTNADKTVELSHTTTFIGTNDVEYAGRVSYARIIQRIVAACPYLPDTSDSQVVLVHWPIAGQIKSHAVVSSAFFGRQKTSDWDI